MFWNDCVLTRVVCTVKAFFLSHSPPRNPRGLFKAYPLGSSCISISSIDSQLAGRHSFAHLGEGSGLPGPLWGVLHEHRSQTTLGFVLS